MWYSWTNISQWFEAEFTKSIKNSESDLLGCIDILLMICMILPSLPFPWCMITLSWYKWSYNKNNPMFYNKSYVSYIVIIGWSKYLEICRHGIDLSWPECSGTLGIIFKTSSDIMDLLNLAEVIEYTCDRGIRYYFYHRTCNLNPQVSWQDLGWFKLTIYMLNHLRKYKIYLYHVIHVPLPWWLRLLETLHHGRGGFLDDVQSILWFLTIQQDRASEAMVFI